MVINNLKTVYEQNKNSTNSAYVRNLLKEVVQNYILSFIYNNKDYKDLIFTGGTCLRKFYNLNRLSEDLDFDYEDDLDLEKLQKDLKDYFNKKLGVKDLSFKVKNYTIFIKLPVLREIGFAGPNDSEILMIRIDFAAKRPNKPETEYKEFIYNGFSFVGRLYNFKSLFLNKTDAFLNRIFKRGDDQKTDFKGRDAYDLIWMLGEIKRNKLEIPELDSKLKVKILDKAKNIKSFDLEFDLKNYVEDQEFVRMFCNNFYNLLESSLKLV